MTKQKLVDGHTIATLLSISPQTVRRMALRGTLPYYRVGRYYRYSIEEVLEYMNKSEGGL